jgi:GTP-binding protein EngB required for normal cell division
MAAPNVIVFGESGVGKSSIINMLNGENTADHAAVSDQAMGLTFSTKPYEKKIDGKYYTIFDTIGLNEGSCGTVKAEDAVQKLWDLINHLVDGVHLLILVMRAPRITQTCEQNYKLFFGTLCQRKVPIAVIITGLESRKDMDGWWVENKKSFDKYSMKFCNHACVTATKGKKRDGRYLYQAQYDASKQQVERLIRDSCGEPLKLGPIAWFLTVIDSIIGLFETEDGARRKRLIEALQTFAGMPKEKAVHTATNIEAQRNAMG